MKYEEKLSEMIRCETVSKLGQSDLSKFYHMHGVLKNLFPHIFAAAEYHDYDGCMLLIWKGSDPSKKPVMFMDHMDVVEPNGEWIYPPFSGTIADGKIWGRGTQDTKEGLFLILQAADELAEEGFVPSQDIYFESTCNEEISGEGANNMALMLKEQGIEFEYIFDEGGKISETEGTASIGISEKSIAELEFAANAEGGHASRPPKNSALVRLGRFMAAVDDSEDLFPAAIVKETGEEEKTTLAFTMAHGSDGRNVLPSRASVITSMRCSHHQGLDGSIAAATAFAAKFGIEVNVLFKGLDAPISPCQISAAGPADASAPAPGSNSGLTPYGKIVSTLEKVYPGIKPRPMIMQGATDALYYTRVCSNIYRFSPIIASEEQLATIHGINENVSVDCLPKGVEFIKTLIKMNN